MGLTERHWFENEDVPENYEWDLEDAVYNSRTNKKHDDLLPQEHRVMTLEEVKNHNNKDNCVWFELRDIVIIPVFSGYA